MPIQRYGQAFFILGAASRYCAGFLLFAQTDKNIEFKSKGHVNTDPDVAAIPVRLNCDHAVPPCAG